MPRFDGTGPNGAGSKTGWGKGICDGANPSVSVPRYGLRGGGMGRGRRCSYFGLGGYQNFSIDEEKEYLKKRLEQLEKESK